MFKEIKQLFTLSVVYGFGSLLTKLLGFVLLPVYTHHLTPTDYGVLALADLTGSILTVVSRMGIGSAMFREVIYRETDEQTVVSTAFNYLALEASVFFLFLIAISPQLANIVFDDVKYTFILRYVFLGQMLGIGDTVVMAYMRIQRKALMYSLYNLGRFILGIALNIVFIVLLRRGIEGLLQARTITLSTSFLVALTMLIHLRALNFSFSLSALWHMLVYGVPLIPFNLANIALTSADRYFLKHYTNTATVGVYQIGYNLGLSLQMIMWAIQLSWPAQMFEIAKQPDSETKFSRILTYYLLGLGSLCLMLSVFSREIIVIMTAEKYYAAYQVIPLVATSYLLFGAAHMVNVALETQSKTKYMAPIIILAVVVNLLSNFVLVPRWGMMGAAWATILAYFTLFVVQLGVNLYFWPIRYEVSRIGKLVISSLFVFGISTLIVTGNIWFDIGLKLVLLVCFPAILFTIDFFSENEITQIILLLRRFTRSVPQMSKR